MRIPFICLFILLAICAAGALAEGTCDHENHSGRNEECWDTFDIIQDIADISYLLVHEAECGDVLDATRTVGSARSPRQMMLNVSFFTYSSGYAAGASKPAEFVQVEMLTFCAKNPQAKLSDF